VDGTFKGFPTSIEQIFLFLASYSLTKMPTGQKLAEYINLYTLALFSHEALYKNKLY